MIGRTRKIGRKGGRKGRREDGLKWKDILWN